MGKENISTQFLYNTLSQTINNEQIDVNKKLEYKWTFFNRDINVENTHNKKFIEFNINIEKINTGKEHYKYNIKHINEENIEDDKYIFLHYILENKDDIEKYNLEEEISKYLRRSKSFTINEDNSYCNENFLFAVSEKGIVICSYDKKAEQDKIRNSSFLTLYLLAIAYNLKMEKFLEDGAKMYKTYIDKKENNSFEGISEIIEFRESIYAFDLQYFFENPVKIDKYELYIIWSIISNCYKVMVRHEEVKNQVLSLTEIIVKNKDQEIQKYEKEKQLQMEKANKIEKSFQNRISLIGLFVAVVPIFIALIDSVKIIENYKTILLISLLLLCIITFFIMFINSRVKEKKIKEINKEL